MFIMECALYEMYKNKLLVLLLSSTHLTFDLTGVRTHDLQIMTVRFMSLRHLH